MTIIASNRKSIFVGCAGLSLSGSHIIYMKFLTTLAIIVKHWCLRVETHLSGEFLSALFPFGRHCPLQLNCHWQHGCHVTHINWDKAADLEW